MKGSGGNHVPDPQRPRVLVLSNLFPNNTQPGRAPFNRQQFAQLGKLTRVHVEAVIPWQFGRGNTDSIVRSEVIDDLTVRHRRYPSIPGVPVLNAGLLAARLARSFRARVSEFDVILASYAYPDGCAGILLGQALNKPVVVKCHGSDLNRVPDDAGPRMQLEKLLGRAERLVVVSERLGKEALRLGVSSERIKVVYNGVDRKKFTEINRAKAREQLSLEQSAELLVCVSHLAEHKGTKDLLDALPYLKKIRPQLTVAFVGDGPMAPQVLDAARRYRPEEVSIIPVGRVPHEEVPTWMAASDFITLPSWDEGMPNVVREAHVMGRPVIATEVGGIPEAITCDELGRLVPRKNPEELARALVQSFEKGAAPASEVQKLASVPTWEESAENLLTVLKEAVNERHDLS
ncbi:MAG: glycosyltransferase [Myxococcota bacterium]|nr:glycosyltransferase [Myxococcota bacterium]